MKNKKSIYLLLPIVLGIWGMVLYQFFSITNPEKPVSKHDFLQLDLKPLKIAENDSSFLIEVNYRDPFLGNNSDLNTEEEDFEPEVEEPIIEAPIIEPLVWPKLIYKGMVSDTKDKKKVFIVEINGRSLMMKLGAIEHEVVLQSGNRKTISVGFKGELKTLSIAE